MASRLEELGNERLRKVSDTVYQEANPPNDRHRPLEWRRSLKHVLFPLKNIEIISNFNVQRRAFLYGHDAKKIPWQKQIEPKMETTRFITALVDKEKCRDFIFCAVEDAENNGITRLERPSNDTQVNLRAGKPTEGNDVFPSGLYGGSCYHFPQENRLCFQIYVPESQLNEILESLGRDSKLQIEIGVEFLSFSYEVDDALRDPFDEQYLFIEEPDSAEALVSFVKISSHAGTLPDSLPGSPNRPIELSGIIRALRTLTIAVWVLIGVAAYSLIK